MSKLNHSLDSEMDCLYDVLSLIAGTQNTLTGNDVEQCHSRNLLRMAENKIHETIGHLDELSMGSAH